MTVSKKLSEKKKQHFRSLEEFVCLDERQDFRSRGEFLRVAGETRFLEQAPQVRPDVVAVVWLVELRERVDFLVQLWPVAHLDGICEHDHATGLEDAVHLRHDLLPDLRGELVEQVDAGDGVVGGVRHGNVLRGSLQKIRPAGRLAAAAGSVASEEVPVRHVLPRLLEVEGGEVEPGDVSRGEVVLHEGGEPARPARKFHDLGR
mmetsp:Transcript_6348/g.16379  ORF Transcript_6348/g.16379 Transcript_6348/m.16379 type:complete len:204 (+) Transcript_6348:950-1561(+)